MKRFLIFLIGISFTAALAACAQNSSVPPAAVATPTAATPPQAVTRASGVHALAMDARGEKLYKAASDGLFVSRNEGKTWDKVPLPTEIAGKGVSQVAVRPASPDTIFVAGEEIGIWRSRDAGKTWSNAGRNLGNGRVTALTLHSNGYPRDESKGLYVWLAGLGVMESHDDGESWKRAADAMLGLDDQNVTALTHSPLPESMNTGWLYASTASGAYLSMDCF